MTRTWKADTCWGWLHWWLYQLLPRDQEEDHLRVALTLFTFCFIHGAPDGQLPEPLLPVLADRAASAVTPMLQQAIASPDVATLDAIVALWRRILDHTPADHSFRARRLVNLATLLDARFERTDTTADLDAAIATLHEAVQITPADHPDRQDSSISWRVSCRRDTSGRTPRQTSTRPSRPCTRRCRSLPPTTPTGQGSSAT